MQSLFNWYYLLNL